VRELVREAVERALGPDRGAAPAAAPAPAPASRAARRVALGSDHGGFPLKEILKRAIAEDLGWDVHDCGTFGTDAVDYPDFAAAVGREVAAGRCTFGIVVDAAGIGSTMAANKISGVRCALCHDDVTATNAREHNDANVMALGSRVVNRGLATRLARIFLTTPVAGGRHGRPRAKLTGFERAQ